MKKGFELLKTRPLKDKISFTSLENELGIKVPPYYRLFHETFIIPENDNHFWYMSEINELKPILSKKYTGYSKEELGINFLSTFDIVSNYLEAYNNYKKYEFAEGEINLFYEKLLLPIGNCEAYNRYGGGIGVGTQGEEQDKIILIRDPEDEAQVEIIADNVFEFVRGIESFIAWEEPNVKDLYKNWGEDFWRVRKEKDKT